MVKESSLKHMRSGTIDGEVHALEAFVVSKHIELSAGISIRAFLTQCKKITDARLQNKITKREIKMRATVPLSLQQIIDKIIRPH